MMQVYDGNCGTLETELTGAASVVGGGDVCVLLGRFILLGGPTAQGDSGLPVLQMP